MDCTTGMVDWTVRLSLAVPNKSPDQCEPRNVVMIFHVAAETAADAWQLALQAFKVEVVIKDKIYQRESMRVWIEC